jgi:hypothetical protein
VPCTLVTMKSKRARVNRSANTQLVVWRRRGSFAKTISSGSAVTLSARQAGTRVASERVMASTIVNIAKLCRRLGCATYDICTCSSACRAGNVVLYFS